MSDFHMVVCVKAVPGSTEVKMDPKTNTIVRDGKQAVVNPFDASALECALALKDDFIGFGMDVRVTVVSMGIPATESLLRDCIARGADDAKSYFPSSGSNCAQANSAKWVNSKPKSCICLKSLSH